ncbi:glycosyltransferase [Sphingomonas sp. PP-CC-3G-468]|uniref:glycosyltransferase n=1 Tax=Sphingomonas sp. PP-CC-3G-468 TaxID=2135656 RepID=UPI0010D508BC|nr:glycosyltransferase [Sphingomonas sp. PP-CC-3G-468]TCM07503.1 glycosyl transferase family 1 [Sphingomonas sp. PP-CC-3G-468]
MRDRPILLVSPLADDAPPGGRAMLARAHRAALRDLFGDDLVTCRTDGGVSGPLDAVAHGHIDGVNAASLSGIIDLIRRRGIAQLYLDGSNLGAVARAVRRAGVDVRIVTFFHNVEARFFVGALRDRPSARAAGVLAANWRAERWATRYSDTIVCLNVRDGELLQRWYGRRADAILPLVMTDRPVAAEPRGPGGDFVLFVGGGFYANRAGAAWFARNVAPRIGVRTVVVGRDLPPLAGVDVVGAVDDLAPWYRDARLVIAPIFDGSGMKTKVAEALMHGKRVVGTPEAFTGYASAVVTAGRLAGDADGFVAAIAAMLADDPPSFDPAMRALFDRYHGPQAARAGLAAIMTSSAGAGQPTGPPA